MKIEIESTDYPAFRFLIFHVNLISPLNIDDKVVAGQQLGTHIGRQTMSDISVIVNDPSHEGRMVSYFLLLTDEVFATYQQRGILSREELIISKELCDANPLQCDGETFTSSGWIAELGRIDSISSIKS